MALTLQTRARLAVPLYWLAGKFLTWANWVDGPQPRKRKVKHSDDCKGYAIMYASIPPKPGYSGCTCGVGDK